ncbi:MAG: IS5 family transposase [Phycisphaeraceae bacterium]|nr:IS5 family transposase [Phycisphaeraceae bacterium]MBX3356596.1 IS5 family transposase [Phycisphaeraceae bacterium]
MAQRVNAEFGLVDGMTADLGGPRTARLLDRLDKSVSWKELVAPIAKLPEYREKRGVGRPAWQPETMLRALLLAKWFNLSDPQLEECLKDRLSFRRFVGLSLTDATPDETTFVVFRRRLRDAGLDRTIFDATLAQLEKRGLLVKEGTLVDATIIEQSRGSHRDDGTSTRDPEASFTKKSGQTHFGFKGHIAADRSSLVTDFRFSDAAPHDSNFIDELTEDETSMVVADTAYRSEERERKLLARGVTPVIAFKRQRGEKELAKELRVFNRIVASLRAVVEHPFAWMKRTGYRRVRYRGLRRNAFDFALHLVAYNWRRSLSLARA